MPWWWPSSRNRYTVHILLLLLCGRYGGWHQQGLDAHGGWVTSPRQFLQLIRLVYPHCDGNIQQQNDHHCLLSKSFTSRYTSESWSHSGALPGTQTATATNPSTGYSWALFLNYRHAPSSMYDLMASAIPCVEANGGWPADFNDGLASPAPSMLPAPGSVDVCPAGYHTSAFAQVGTLGWCTNSNGGEGTARAFVTGGGTLTNLKALCENDNDCVAVSHSNTAGASSVLYTSRGCQSGCTNKAWLNDPTLVVGSSGDSRYTCHAKPRGASIGLCVAKPAVCGVNAYLQNSPRTCVACPTGQHKPGTNALPCTSHTTMTSTTTTTVDHTATGAFAKGMPFR